MERFPFLSVSVHVDHRRSTDVRLIELRQESTARHRPQAVNIVNAVIGREVFGISLEFGRPPLPFELLAPGGVYPERQGHRTNMEVSALNR